MANTNKQASKPELKSHEEDGLVGFFIIFGLAAATVIGAIGWFLWWAMETIIRF